MSSEGTLTDESFPAVSLEDWQERVADRLEGGDVEALERLSPDGVAIRPLYLERQFLREPLERGGPGAGSGACALIEAADPLEARLSLRRSLAAGADGIYLRLDRSTRLGLDPEDDAALEHLGVGGMVLGGGTELAVMLDESDCQRPGGLAGSGWQRPTGDRCVVG